MRPKRSLLKIFAALFCAISIPLSAHLHAQSYKVTNLVSDGSVAATVTDPNFINPWGVSTSGTWWISTANTGFNYVVSSAPAISFKVIVPTAASPNQLPGLPAGSVTTGGTVGMVLTNGTKASFIFSTLDGTISGWNSKLGTANAISQVMVNNSAAGASYPGLAILNQVTGGVTTASYILAPNFGKGNAIEVYDSTFKPAKLTGSFTDPNLPAGYSPYAIHIINQQVFVTYAVRTAAAPYLTVNARGNGVVDVFDTNGNFVSRVATGGNLNSPWGVAVAPANFGVFSNDLLIGNFGDGTINAYDPKTFVWQGQMVDATAKPLSYASLWELLPGGTTVGGTTAVSGGDTSTVYFTAGLASEQHGLFGAITNGATTGATPAFAFGAAAPAVSVTAGGTASMPFSLVPVNGFSGTVSLACSGLPVDAQCSFSPSSVSVSSTAPATGTISITTSGKSASLGALPKGLTLAFLFPTVGLLAFRKRRWAVPALGVLLIGAAGAMSGCAGGTGSLSQTVAPTPVGASTVTVTATAGAATQTSSFTLNVQ